MKNVMSRAWEIRYNAAKKWDCEVSEIIFSFCLKMAHKGEKLMTGMIEKVETAGYSINNAGYINFKNKKWNFVGDKATWVKVSEDTVIIKIGKGTISRDYEAEIDAFCELFGVDFIDLACGSTHKLA